MIIVPRDNPLEVEAILDNKDIGFVSAGQEAEIKIETFPFTKYGTIPGHVTQVSGTIRVGIAFEEPEGGAGIELTALTTWLDARKEAMKQWDRGFD